VFKGILKYSSVELVAKGLNKLLLFILPLFIDTIGYGKIGIIISIELILPILLMLGFDRVVLRFFSSEKNLSKSKSTVFVSIFFTGILSIIICFIFSAFQLNIFNITLYPELLLLFILVFLYNIYFINVTILRVEENHTLYFEVRLVYQVLKLILILSLITLYKDSIGYILGGGLALLAINLKYFFKSFKHGISSFDYVIFKRFLLFSFPFIIHGLSKVLIGNADKLILGHFLSLKDVGAYTLAHAYGSSMFFAFVGVSVYVEPLVYKQSDENSRKKILNSFFNYSTYLGVLAFLLLIVFVEYLFPIFYSSSYDYSKELILSIGGVFLFSPYYLKSNYELIYNERTKIIAAVSVFCSLINISLNFILIPKLGLKGAVVSFYVAYAIQSLIFCLISKNSSLKILSGFFFLSLIILSLIIYNCSVFLIPLLIIYTMWVIYEQKNGQN
jgi:O-antigen/teichoic acid export membrane protein